MRLQASGRLHLSLPAWKAISLFTPEGERLWAPGWDPHYPAGEASEEAGTVFVTRAGEVETTWVIIGIDRELYSAAYARLTPGRHGGTVTVTCRDDGQDRCVASVRYDLTSLTNSDDVLSPYRPEAFAEMMAEWDHRIRPHVGAR
ncbi:MAG: hypothetical protein ACLFWM_11575 [Actinomycetota bacterium]